MTTNISIISSYNYYMKCYFVAIVCVFVCQFNCECVAVLFVLQLILMVQFETLGIILMASLNWRLHHF